MKKEISKIAFEIEKLAKNSDLNQNQIVKELENYFKLKSYDIFIDLYKNREKKVTEICKEFHISPKRFYKILKKKGIEVKKYKKRNI